MKSEQEDQAAFIALQEALLGRYSVERELGHGGMGVVYLARDVRLDRPVAIKVLRRELADRAEARERFLREARTAARLAHPHVVPIYSVEERESLVFFVMALIDGETLGERLRRRGPLPPDDAERVLREVAWALGYAHMHGVVHRDLTLENVLLERGSGRALLVDFGIAAERDMIDTGPVFGTPGYLAPELIRGEPADARSDLYALGCVGFAALSGRLPFPADTAGELLAKHLVQPPPSLAPLAHGASRRLVAAIEACLIKDRDARPADTAAFLALLERAPEPVVVAPALRSWFTRWERIRPVYAIATPILALQTWLMVFVEGQLSYRVGQSHTLVIMAFASVVLTLTAIPVAAHLLFEANALRKLRQRGFGIDDIRAAYPHWREALQHERRKDGLPPLPGRVVLDLTLVGAVVLAITFAFIYPNIPHWYSWSGEAGYVQGVILQMASSIYLATMTGIGIGFASPGFRVAPNGAFRRLVERFWNSRLARGVARLAAMGQREQLVASSTLHRNTELVLGLAVDDLWKNIPGETRSELGDVPALAHTLQASATELRDLIERLRISERDLAADGHEIGNFSATRATLEVQHRAAIEALERVRLQLLRLVATKERTSELTHQLEQARALETTLLRDIAGHGEVRRILGRPKRRPVAGSPTPAPTPA